MKPFEATQHEIQHTIEMIGRMNASIARHKAQEEPDQLAIEQYQSVKKSLVSQLLELLSEMDIHVLEAA